MMPDDGHTTRGGATQLRGDATQRRTDGAKVLPRREKIYVPKIMMDTMLSATGNGTSLHFGYGHLCGKHNKLFSLSHIEECDALSGVGDIRKYFNKLKEVHLLEWQREERLQAITAFALLTLQMQNLSE